MWKVTEVDKLRRPSGPVELAAAKRQIPRAGPIWVSFGDGAENRFEREPTRSRHVI